MTKVSGDRDVEKRGFVSEQAKATCLGTRQQEAPGIAVQLATCAHALQARGHGSTRAHRSPTRTQLKTQLELNSPSVSPFFLLNDSEISAPKL